jgi:uncharacterized glyoxalase superfamily protein PhnB
MPRCTVIPELAYPDVGLGVDWLCEAFGFTVRIRIGGHRAQLNVGDGAVVVTGRGVAGQDSADRAHSVMVRVQDVDRHHEQAARRGARILRAPDDYPYGERQYSAEDPGGHCWTFSQSIADVAPEGWGGVAGQL